MAVSPRDGDCILVVGIGVIWRKWPGVAGMDPMTPGIDMNVFIGHLWAGWMWRNNGLRLWMYGADDSSRTPRKAVFVILETRFLFGY